MARVTLRLEGTSPLLMHNVQLADPDNEFAKEISNYTSKRRKTEEDRVGISHWEWLGGLYLGEGGPVIPTQNVKKSLIQTGKISRLGTAVQRAFIPIGLEVPLEYDGPRTPSELWELKRFVHRAPAKVGTSTVIRTRPCFPDWAITVEAEVLTDVLDLDDFTDLVARAGIVEGLGDGRSMGYGRYTGVVKGE